MIDFTLTVLGANSAIPVPGRFSSSFILTHNQKPILIDCGEGAQIKMSQFSIKRSKIEYVFISHLHGDHIYGLPGFIGSLGLNNRKKPLHIFGPLGLKKFIAASFEATESTATFVLNITELDGLKEHDIGVVNGLSVRAFPLKHRIPTLGYRFDELARSPKIKRSAISDYSLSIEEIKEIKSGKSITRDGKELPIEVLTESAEKLRSFAYCSDTIYDESLIQHVLHANLLYHEATYLKDLTDKAHERMHSTAFQAGQLAKKSEVQNLLIGHYSSRYRDLQPLLHEAQSVFKRSVLAEEGKVVIISN